MLPLTIPDAAAFLARLDTAALAACQGDAPTRALVVVNAGNAPGCGLVRFHAAFPVRAAVGAQPVTVCDEQGEVVPSRLAESTVEARPDLGLSADRLWWTLTLEFVAEDVPARGWRAYAAVFDASPKSRSEDADFWRGVSETGWTPLETDCHEGDLPIRGTFDRLV